MRDREFQNTPWEAGPVVAVDGMFLPNFEILGEDTPVLSASYDDVVSIIDLVKQLVGKYKQYCSSSPRC